MQKLSRTCGPKADARWDHRSLSHPHPAFAAQLWNMKRRDRSHGVPSQNPSNCRSSLGEHNGSYAKTDDMMALEERYRALQRCSINPGASAFKAALIDCRYLIQQQWS